ncbi:hypothetical protein, partial [Croceicoccus bisphenolivorans]|uniref:hypothetical protein n=1 Tax=Croceicoccus bisphenolivorans TaxID=1783232 RepID=UPI000A9F1FEB
MLKIFDIRKTDNDGNSFNYTSGDGFYGPDVTTQTWTNIDPLPFYVKHLNFKESQDYGATGTGLFAPFLNINGGSTILGFNTDQDVPGSDKSTDISNPNTNALQFYEIPIVYLDLDGNGTPEAYYQINLDINENNNIDVSLEALQLYVSEAGDGVNGTGYATLDDFIVGGTRAFAGDFQIVFDLDDLDLDGAVDNGGDGARMLLSDLGAGQGKQDYIFYFPVEMFGDVDPEDFLTLYSQFGPDPADDAGFAEWNTLKSTQIHGIKFNDVNGDGVYQSATETLLNGFTVYIDINGNNQLDVFEQWAVSGEAGSTGAFTFFSLLPNSNYVIREVLSESDMTADFIAANGGDASAFLPTGIWDQTTGNSDGDHIVVVGSPGNYTVQVGNHELTPDFTAVKTIVSINDGPDAGG